MPPSNDGSRAYDAILLLGFGGPEGPDDVLPFLRNVTKGRGVPDERLAVVGEHYARFDGVSPINDQNRSLLAALRPALDDAGVDIPLYWGNRNWHPMLSDTWARMADDGIRSALVIATSAYSSYSSCRQYQENLDAATEELGDRSPSWFKIRPFFNHPGFIDASVERAVADLSDVAPGTVVRFLFTAHSIPESMSANCDYAEQLSDAATSVMAGLKIARPDLAQEWDLVYQSRSGPPSVPWLEPDVLDAIRALDASEAATPHLVIIPIGFISDHMEVMFDLDVEAVDLAAELGIEMTRVATVGTHPRFVGGLVDLVREQTDHAKPVAVGNLAPRPSPCAEGCCPAGAGRPGRPSTA